MSSGERDKYRLPKMYPHELALLPKRPLDPEMDLIKASDQIAELPVIGGVATNFVKVLRVNIG